MCLDVVLTCPVEYSTPQVSVGIPVLPFPAPFQAHVPRSTLVEIGVARFDETYL